MVLAQDALIPPGKATGKQADFFPAQATRLQDFPPIVSSHEKNRLSAAWHALGLDLLRQPALPVRRLFPTSQSVHPGLAVPMGCQSGQPSGVCHPASLNPQKNIRPTAGLLTRSFNYEPGCAAACDNNPYPMLPPVTLTPAHGKNAGRCSATPAGASRCPGRP